MIPVGPKSWTNTLFNITAFAPLIQLNWKAADRLATAIAKTATSTSASPGSTITIEATSTTYPLSTTEGLSTGGKAAIGVVIPVVVLAIIAVLAMLLYLRKQNRSRTDSSQRQDKPELDGSKEARRIFAELSELDQVHELAPEGRHELDSEVRHELPVLDIVHELEASELAIISHGAAISQQIRSN